MEMNVRNQSGRRYWVPVLLVGLLAMIGCEPAEYRSYTGKAIQIDFGAMEGVTEDQWIEVEDIRFTHTQDMYQFANETLYLPTSQVEYEETLTPMNPHEVALHFASRLQETMNIANSESEDGPVYQIKVVQDLNLYGASLLTLRAEEGEFTIRTSREYGIPVQVVE